MKKLAAIIIILCCALISTGTFAWLSLPRETRVLSSDECRIEIESKIGNMRVTEEYETPTDYELRKDQRPVAVITKYNKKGEVVEKGKFFSPDGTDKYSVLYFWSKKDAKTDFTLTENASEDVLTGEFELITDDFEQKIVFDETVKGTVSFWKCQKGEETSAFSAGFYKADGTADVNYNGETVECRQYILYRYKYGENGLNVAGKEKVGKAAVSNDGSMMFFEDEVWKKIK